MISATWFRKAKPPQAVVSGESAPARPPETSVVEAATAAAPAAVADEAIAKAEIAPAAGDRPTAAGSSAAASSFRASRLVEAGRLSSATLKTRLTTALAGAEPWGKPAGVAAAILVAGTLGFVGGTASSGNSQDALASARLSETAAGIRENREDVARLAADMKSLRTALDGLRTERRAGDLSVRQAQLSERMERSSTDTSGKMARLADQLDRIEKTQRDPARLGAIVDRLERIEKHVQTASAAPSTSPSSTAKPVAASGSPAPAGDVTQTGSLPSDARPPARPAEVVDPRKSAAEGYTLRDVEDGFALVEGRNGRFFEVSPGMSLPGLGRVEAIERRGRQWVVVTPKGYVGER